MTFVHVFTPETAPAPVSAPALALASLSELEELEEEVFKPGELFAQHKLQANATSDTGYLFTFIYTGLLKECAVLQGGSYH